MKNSLQIYCDTKEKWEVVVAYLMSLGYRWAVADGISNLVELYKCRTWSKPYEAYPYLVIHGYSKVIGGNFCADNWNNYKNIDFNFLFSDDFEKYWEPEKPKFIEVKSNNGGPAIGVHKGGLVIETALNIFTYDVDTIDKLVEARRQLNS